jgi:hypothetical protein
MNKNKATREGASSTGVSPYLIPDTTEGDIQGRGDFGIQYRGLQLGDNTLILQ